MQMEFQLFESTINDSYNNDIHHDRFIECIFIECILLNEYEIIKINVVF